MRRTALAAPVLAALAAVSCGAGNKPEATTTTASVACGHHDNATTYCGNATATVDVGGRTVSYAGGECHSGPGHVVVAIGTFPDQAATTPDRFALGVGNYEQDVLFGTVTTPAPSGPGAAGDGTYLRSTLRAYTGGARYSASNFSVTIEGGRTRGTFSATADNGTAITGRFSC